MASRVNGQPSWFVLLAVLAMLPFAPSPARAAASADTTRPRVQIATEEGAVLVGPSETTGMLIQGSVSDKRRVREVVLVYTNETDLLVERVYSVGVSDAELACGPRRRACTWQAHLPPGVGEWELTAIAWDAAGNRRKSKPTRVVVASPT